MPVVYDIDRVRQRIHTRCIGPVTLSDVLEHFATLIRDPNRPDRMDVLLDLSETTSFPTTDELRAVTFEIGRIRPNVQFGRCAIETSNETWSGLHVCSRCSRPATSTPPTSLMLSARQSSGSTRSMVPDLRGARGR